MRWARPCLTSHQRKTPYPSLFAGRTLTYSISDRLCVRSHHNDIAKLCIHYLCQTPKRVDRGSIQQCNNTTTTIEKFW